STLAGILAAAKADGFDLIHFNFASAGLPSLPEPEDLIRCEGIRGDLTSAGMNLAAVSGTFNAIHPVQAVRANFIHRCQGVIRSAPLLGTDMVTLRTGSADADNMWKAPPDNDTPEAWRELLSTLEQLVPVAEEAGVFLGVEPET